MKTAASASRRTLTAALLLAAFSGAVGSAIANDATVNSRFHRSVEGRSGPEGALESRLPSAPVQEFGALADEGFRTLPRAGARSKGMDRPASNRNADHEDRVFLVWDADSSVFYDFDRDGYFHGFSVTFDVDVSEGWADIYAELYLSRNGGPWNAYYTTGVFSIFGADSSDAYEVVTELDSGYPAGDYDVLVEVFDADTGDFLAYYGPEDDAALSFLPLEDAGRDLPPRRAVYYGGSGSTGPIALLTLLLLAVVIPVARTRATDQARRVPG